VLYVYVEKVDVVERRSSLYENENVESWRCSSRKIQAMDDFCLHFGNLSERKDFRRFSFADAHQPSDTLALIRPFGTLSTLLDLRLQPAAEESPAFWP
jgi:hypothetical protein